MIQENAVSKTMVLLRMILTPTLDSYVSNLTHCCPSSEKPANERSAQGFSHAEEIYAKQIAGHDAEVAKVQMDAAERNQMQEQIVGLQSENSQMEAKLRKLGELRKALNEFLG